MNTLTTEKYSAMTDQTSDLVSLMLELQKKCTPLFFAEPIIDKIIYAGETFQPYLEQIDQIETSVNELEQTVLLMDEYTKQLEGKFRKLKEREREREREEAKKGKRLSKWWEGG